MVRLLDRCILIKQDSIKLKACKPFDANSAKQDPNSANKIHTRPVYRFGSFFMTSLAFAPILPVPV